MEEIKIFLNQYGAGWKDYYGILYKLAYGQLYFSGAPIVDIGTDLAGSALTMAHASQQVGLGTVFSVDIRMRRESLSFEQALNFGLYREAVGGAFFTEHIIGLSRLGHRITSIYASSDNALELLKFISPCVIFIDGSHSYHQVVSDLQNYGEILISGGVMICHDYNVPDVHRAIDEILRTDRYEGFTCHHETVYAYKKDENIS